jgi:hypothetical protein
MSKQLLVDYIPFHVAKLSLVESKGNTDGRMRIEGKLQQADVKNGNGRVYPLDILKTQVDAYIKGPVVSKTSTGELDHPDASIINLSNVSHLITKIWWEGNDVMGELLLLNTPSGKIAQEIITAGIPLGISSRGMGSVKQIGESVEVQDDFELLCWDLVSVPSTPGAYMQQIGTTKLVGKLSIDESKQYNTHNDYSKVNSLITEIICTQTGVCALC